MADIESFPPIAAANARVLILGSIPGQASLAAGQYYAHPRNQFWPIMADLLGGLVVWDYAAKIRMLLHARVALWDVMKSCHRPGSLDAAIVKNSMVANDFKGFLLAHPDIAYVFFNGATAEQTFRRLVLPGLDQVSLTLQRLPSTSPAHAALSYQQKLQRWRVILHALSADASEAHARTSTS